MTPEFVEFIPEDKKEGVIYISKKYEIAIHLCACGCRNQVVTPFCPGEWQLTIDEGKVTLHPSIGNRFACKSHYWIINNEVALI